MDFNKGGRTVLGTMLSRVVRSSVNEGGGVGGGYTYYVVGRCACWNNVLCYLHWWPSPKRFYALSQWCKQISFVEKYNANWVFSPMLNFYLRCSWVKLRRCLWEYINFFVMDVISQLYSRGFWNRKLLKRSLPRLTLWILICHALFPGYVQWLLLLKNHK